MRVFYLLLFAVGFALSAEAQSASVVVRGAPSGSEVYASGALMAPGEPVWFDEPTLVRVVLPDGTAVERWLDPQRGDHALVVGEARFRPERLAMAIAAPGMAEWVDGRRGAAVLLLGGVAAGVATTALGVASTEAAEGTFGRLVSEYERAPTEETAIAAREAAEAQAARVDRARTVKAVGLSVLAASLAASVVDVARYHATRRSTRLVPLDASVGLGVSPAGPALTLRFSL